MQKAVKDASSIYSLVRIWKIRHWLLSSKTLESIYMVTVGDKKYIKDYNTLL